jgi:hypothetical protein
MILVANPALAMFYSCLCRCRTGGPGAGSGSGAGSIVRAGGTDEQYFSAVLSPAGAGALEAQLANLPPAIQAAARRAHEKRQADFYDRQRRAVEQAKPTFFVNDCGGARDCLSSQSWQGALPGARRNAEAWASLDPKRTVYIYDAPGGALLDVVKGSDLLSTFVAATTKTEQEQQKLASKTFLGKI